jgi:hypothetical protein
MALGYRMVSFDFDNLSVTTKQFGHKVDIHDKEENVFDNGLYLGSDESFLDYYRDDPDPDERRQDIKLTYEYNPEDLLQGDGSPDQELIVSKAKLVNAEFFDEQMQVNWEHLLSPTSTEKRRSIHEASEVNLNSQVGCVVRAQDSKMDFLLDCDYCYQYRGMVTTRKGLERVVESLEEGIQLTNGNEMLLSKALSHAVTMAITSGLEKKVVIYPVKQGELFESTNADEYFYKGRPKNTGKVLFEVSPDGVINVADKKLKKDYESEPSLRS